MIAGQKPEDLPRGAVSRSRRRERRPCFVSAPPRHLDLVEETLGAVGWRLHGNMLHLAHGNPAVFFANNSRAESFCEAFGLPCVRSPDRVRLDDDWNSSSTRSGS